MIIKSMTREHNYCSVVALTPEHVYNAWMQGNNLHFYILSNDKTTNVVNYLITASIKSGKIKLVIDGEAFTLYSHDELINTIRCAFPEDWHDVITIFETLLYVE